MKIWIVDWGFEGIAAYRRSSIAHQLQLLKGSYMGDDNAIDDITKIQQAIFAGETEFIFDGISGELVDLI